MVREDFSGRIEIVQKLFKELKPNVQTLTEGLAKDHKYDSNAPPEGAKWKKAEFNLDEICVCVWEFLDLVSYTVCLTKKEVFLWRKLNFSSFFQ